MNITGDGLDALLTILANLARPQAPQMAPEAQNNPAPTGPAVQAERPRSNSLDEWWACLNDDTKWQSEWERQHEWNEDSRDPQEP